MQGSDPIQTTEAKHFRRKHLRYTYVLNTPLAQGYECVYIYLYIYYPL